MIIDDFKKIKFPDNPGVYFFKNGDEILYIGRATSLKDRVKSYFSPDLLFQRSSFIVDMVNVAKKIEHIQTDSILEAIILEANLIKKYQPKYNTAEKDDKSFSYVIITEEEFPRVLLVRGKELEDNYKEKELKYVFGPYPQGIVLREGMKIVRKIFSYRDKCVPVSVSNADNLKVNAKPCFESQIGLCPGVCSGKISRKEYGRIIQNIRLFFEGKKGALLKKLKREMNEYAKKQEFEKAESVRKTIFTLTHIQDVTLIKSETKAEENADGTMERPAFRMEGYDVAHMSGNNIGGVMVVIEDNHIKKSDYRLFKIRGQRGADDTKALKETLERRLNHKEWLFPNAIVVDGGIAQINTAKEILRERRLNKIEIIAVVKNERHRPENIIGNQELIKKYKKEILLLNSEAHRFAIKYHRKLRGSFLGR